MNRRSTTLILLSAGLVAVGSVGLAAEEPTKPPMHMHKSEMNHDTPDKEVAAEFESEAAQLYEKAASHRKLAQMYRTRTPLKGGASYANVAKHCDSLANYYEQAAKEAAAVSSELAK
ncbi:MAG TPA: hypothetical protein VJS12_14630 [Steroidobacteraceae bacterium]|nr:hypothetical protein [Steroidobacteraceae bacterium]